MRPHPGNLGFSRIRDAKFNVLKIKVWNDKEREFAFVGGTRAVCFAMIGLIDRIYFNVRRPATLNTTPSLKTTGKKK